MNRNYRPIPVALRFDDPSPRSNHAIESAVIEMLRKHDAKATFAVIPFQHTPEGVVELRQGQLPQVEDAASDQLIEIALHGCFHQKNTMDWESRPSEFYGMQEAEQRSLIEKGLSQLQKVFADPIVGFVPPWNSFDATTMQVTRDLGFEYISASWEVLESYTERPVLIPKTCALTTLRAAVTRARAYHGLAPVIVSVFHHHDFYEAGDPEGRISLGEFDQLLYWITTQKDLVFADLKTIAAALDAKKALKTLHLADRAGKLHYRLSQRWPRQFFHSCSSTRQVVAMFEAGVRAIVGR